MPSWPMAMPCALGDFGVIGYRDSAMWRVVSSEDDMTAPLPVFPIADPRKRSDHLTTRQDGKLRHTES